MFHMTCLYPNLLIEFRVSQLGTTPQLSFSSLFCPLSSLILPTLLLLPPPQEVSNLFRNPTKYADSSFVVLCYPRYKPTPNRAGVFRRCNVDGFLMTGVVEGDGISDFFVDKLRYICDDLGIVL